jgi:hypothetical protein
MMSFAAIAYDDNVDTTLRELSSQDLAHASDTARTVEELKPDKIGIDGHLRPSSLGKPCGFQLFNNILYQEKDKVDFKGGDLCLIRLHPLIPIGVQDNVVDDVKR